MKIKKLNFKKPRIKKAEEIEAYSASYAATTSYITT